MDLGRCAPRRAVLVALLLLVAVAVPGCESATPGAHLSGDATPTIRAPAFSLGRHAAAGAAADIVGSLPGLHAQVTRCPGGPRCHPVARSAWYVSAERQGARIVDGNGFSARAYVGVVAFRRVRTARHFVRHLRRADRRYDGVFSAAPKPGRDHEYTPGERGVGSLGSVRRGGWRGWTLDLQHAYTFWDGSESVEEYTRKFVARRGRFVCAAFLDGRSLPELRRLVPAWPRLVRALGA